MPRYEDTPLSADYKDVLRRREIANALAERSFMPPGSEMVSGRVIPNWGRGISNIGRAAMSDYTSKKAGERERELSGKYDEESAASMQRIMDTLQGSGGATPNPRKAVMDATVDPYLRGNVSSQRVIDAMIKADAIKQGGRGSPYYKPIYDEEGNIYSFDARSADVAPISFGGGQLSDPRYATSARRNIKAAEQMGTGGAEAITDPITARNVAAAEAEEKRAQTAVGSTELIDEAQSIFDGKTKPTASGIGTMIDWIGGQFGASPAGADEASQLKVIGGALVGKVPRFEGQQSDKDVMLYREMAGRIGDSTVPISQRKAALETVRKIWAQYERTKTANPPGEAAPEGVDQNIWDVMTPEERKLWQ